MLPGTQTLERSIVALSILILLSGCGKEPNAPSPSIAIQNTIPSGDEGLLINSVVDFSITVRISGLHSAGRTQLVIQDAKGTMLASSDLFQMKESLTINAKIKIPDTTTVVVFTPLYIGENLETSHMDIRNFKVLGRLIN